MSSGAASSSSDALIQIHPGRRGPLARAARPPAAALHSALLPDVRLQLRRLPVRVPAPAHRPLPHPRCRRRHGRGRAVPRLPDLRVRLLRAVHRRHRRSHRPPPHAGHLQQRDLPDVVRLRHDDDVAADAGDRVRARPVLVGPADRGRRLRHRPDARQPPRRRHRLLRHLDDPRRRRRPRGRPLGLSARLALALRLHWHIEFDDGDYCDAVGGISTQYRRGGEAVAVARSAGVARDDRVADAVPDFVRLRGHHELRGDLREGERGHAAEPVLFGDARSRWC